LKFENNCNSKFKYAGTGNVYLLSFCLNLKYFHLFILRKGILLIDMN